MDKTIEPSKTYTLYEIQKALEWGMKPLLDLYDLETAREILLEKHKVECPADEKNILLSIGELSNINISHNQISLIFRNHPKTTLTLKKGILGRNKLVGPGVKLNVEDKEFFESFLTNAMRIVNSYPKNIPTNKNETFKSKIPVNTIYGTHCYFPMHPGHVTTYTGSKHVIEHKLYLELKQLSKNEIPLEMLKLLDLNYLNLPKSEQKTYKKTTFC